MRKSYVYWAAEGPHQMVRAMAPPDHTPLVRRDAAAIRPARVARWIRRITARLSAGHSMSSRSPTNRSGVLPSSRAAARLA